MPVAEFVPERVAYYLKSTPTSSPASASCRPRSAYPWALEHHDPEFAAHVLGYLGQIHRQGVRGSEVRPRTHRVRANDLVGAGGVEQVYEKYLAVRSGAQKYIVNSHGGRSATLRWAARRSPATTSCCRSTRHPGARRGGAPGTGIDRARYDRRRAVGHVPEGRPAVRRSCSTPDRRDRRDGVLSRPTTPSGSSRASPLSRSNYRFGNDTLAPSLNRVTSRSTRRARPSSRSSRSSAAQGRGRLVLELLRLSGGVRGRRATPSGASFGNWSTSGLGYMSIAQALKISCDTYLLRLRDEFCFNVARAPAAANSEPFQRRSPSVRLREADRGRPSAARRAARSPSAK